MQMTLSLIEITQNLKRLVGRTSAVLWLFITKSDHATFVHSGGKL